MLFPGLQGDANGIKEAFHIPWKAHGALSRAPEQVAGRSLIQDADDWPAAREVFVDLPRVDLCVGVSAVPQENEEIRALHGGQRLEVRARRHEFHDAGESGTRDGRIVESFVASHEAEAERLAARGRLRDVPGGDSDSRRDFG